MHLSIFQVVEWVLAIVGVIGVPLAIAAIVIFPLVVGPIFKTVISLAETILETRIGLATAVGITAFIVGGIIGDHDGRRVEKDKCVAAQIQADKEAKQRDVDQGKLADNDADQQLKDLKVQHDKDQQELDRYRTTNAGAACHPLTADDLK